MEQKHVDEIMRGVQGALEETQVDRFPTVSVRMGVAGTLTAPLGFYFANPNWRITVAQVIEFYVPTGFSTRVKWLPPQQRGRVIVFRLPSKKSA